MEARFPIYIALLASLTGVWLGNPWRLCRVQGASMEPALHDGEWLLVERHYYRGHRPRRGEVVVFRHEGALYLKRVAAVGGEELLMLCNGDPREAGSMIWPVHAEEEAVIRAFARGSPHLRLVRLRVPPRSFYALGDALPCSLDSRELGAIPESALIGRVRRLSGSLPPSEALQPLERVRRPPRRALPPELPPPPRLVRGGADAGRPSGSGGHGGPASYAALTPG